MIEHLANCHGEWSALFALVGSIPFVGVWIRSNIFRKEDPNEER